MSVNGVDDKDYKNADELYKEKNKILHSSDSKTLIIVDNFNVTFDEFLRDFLPNDSDSFKVIFTTRWCYGSRVLQRQDIQFTETVFE